MKSYVDRPAYRWLPSHLEDQARQNSRVHLNSDISPYSTRHVHSCTTLRNETPPLVVLLILILARLLFVHSPCDIIVMFFTRRS